MICPDNDSHPRADSNSPKSTFSQDLKNIAEKFSDHPARISDILEATKGRGFDLLLIFVAIPFVTPIPLPGLSTPFGFVAMIIGARQALGKHPWLPKWLLHRELPPGFLKKILGAANRIVRFLEYFIRPRIAFLHESLVFQQIAGALIMISGALMLLPLPVPYTNTFPAWTILFFAAGSLERDGLFFLGGCILFALTIGYFALIGFGGSQAFDFFRNLLSAITLPISAIA